MSIKFDKSWHHCVSYTVDVAKFLIYNAGDRMLIDVESVQFIELNQLKMSDQYSWWSELLHLDEK